MMTTAAAVSLVTSSTQLADADWIFYAYYPSYPLAIVVASLFLAAFLAHFAIMVRTRTWYMIPFVIGCFLETAGYVLRRISAQHAVGRSNGLIWYILQSLCIILSPALMAATEYMIFGRLIVSVGEKYSPVRARRVTLIFVLFDVTSFVVQGAGGSLYSSNNTNLYKIAKAILVVGFLIQIISFGIFGICAAVYQRRALRAGQAKGNWTKMLLTLYIGCILILIRSIFRTIEFGSGGNNTGYLLTHEAFYYGLEALPILLASYLFLLRHPSRYMPAPGSISDSATDSPQTGTTYTLATKEEKVGSDSSIKLHESGTTGRRLDGVEV